MHERRRPAWKREERGSQVAEYLFPCRFNIRPPEDLTLEQARFDLGDARSLPDQLSLERRKAFIAAKIAAERALLEIANIPLHGWRQLVAPALRPRDHALRRKLRDAPLGQQQQFRDHGERIGNNLLVRHGPY